MAIKIAAHTTPANVVIPEAILVVVGLSYRKLVQQTAHGPRKPRVGKAALTLHVELAVYPNIAPPPVGAPQADVADTIIVPLPNVRAMPMGSDWIESAYTAILALPAYADATRF